MEQAVSSHVRCSPVPSAHTALPTQLHGSWFPCPPSISFRVERGPDDSESSSISSVQLSCPVVFATSWTAACQASLSITNSRSLLKLMSIESVMPSSQLILLSPYPPTFNHSLHQGLSNESVLCLRWPEYQSVSFSISPSNDYSGLISFRMNWLDLLAVQGTLKGLIEKPKL